MVSMVMLSRSSSQTSTGEASQSNGEPLSAFYHEERWLRRGEKIYGRESYGQIVRITTAGRATEPWPAARVRALQRAGRLDVHPLIRGAGPKRRRRYPTVTHRFP